MYKIIEKVNKWFDSQQNTGKMLGDWICIEKDKSNSMHIKIAMNLLKQQKQRTEERFIQDGWHCEAGFKPTLEYYPFHAEETENYLALCWVRHIKRGQ